MDNAESEMPSGEEDSNPKTSAERIRVFCLAILSLSALATLLYVLINVRLLRPIADDYSLAIYASEGLVSGVVELWRSLSGDVTTMFSNLLLVGLPLLYFPWTVASAVPFCSAALSTVGLILWILLKGVPKSVHGGLKLVTASLIAPIVFLCWWGFWWIPVLFSQQSTGNDSAAVATGISIWQNLNAAYVVTTAALIWAWLFLESRSCSERGWLFLAYPIIGIVSGLNGPVFAVGAGIMIIVIAVSSLLRTGTAFHERWSLWLCALAGVSAGALFSYLSPGTQFRSGSVGGIDIGPPIIWRLATESLPAGVDDWWDSLVNPGALVVLLVVSGSVLLLPHARTLNLTYPLNAGIVLLGFAFILSIANRASELFAYPAFWHLILPRTVAWLGLVSTALAIGGWIAQRIHGGLVRPTAAVSTAAGLMLASASIAPMVGLIQARAVLWEHGPAPVPDLITDIEDPDGWQRVAWLKLSTLRESPSRGVDER